MARSDKKNQHARIIWSCAWTGDDRFFATASRDKKVLDGIAVYFSERILKTCALGLGELNFSKRDRDLPVKMFY